MNFKLDMDFKINFINDELKKYLLYENEYSKILFDAMSYSVFAGGKRIRPIFILETAKLFNDDSNIALPFCCAIEFIHTYSLIHDDLPAIDNDDLRRGIPTNHKKFGEDMAILAGDGLLSLAFSVMSNACVISKDYKDILAMDYISKAIGVSGMVSGQVVDVVFDNKLITEDVLNYITLNKTAAMIKACFMAGALVAGASELDVKKLGECGEKIGIAFQMQDDILDIIGDIEKLGKPINSDADNGKTTYATFFELDELKDMINKLYESAMEILKSFGERSSFLIELTKFLINREY